jgi:Zn-finger nucleic acid-binding protein
MERPDLGGCPGCGHVLGAVIADGTRQCDRCMGLWVSQEAIVATLRELTGDGEVGLVAFVTNFEHGWVRSCPACGRAMQAGLLEQLAVDRCPKSHGYWFDVFALETCRFAQTFSDGGMRGAAEGAGSPIGGRRRRPDVA